MIELNLNEVIQNRPLSTPFNTDPITVIAEFMPHAKRYQLGMVSRVARRFLIDSCLGAIDKSERPSWLDIESYSQVIWFSLLKKNPSIFLNYPKNKHLFYVVVHQDPFLLRYADRSVRDENKILFVAIKKDGMSLQLASERLRNAGTVVLRAIEENHRAFFDASAALQEDKRFTLKYIQKTKESIAKKCMLSTLVICVDYLLCDRCMIKSVMATINCEYDFALQDVQNDGLILEFVSDKYRNNAEIVSKAVVQNGLALQYASEQLRKKKEIVLEAVKQNGHALQYASEELKDNQEVVLAAVNQNGLALRYASEELKNNQEVVLAAVKQNELALQYASYELQNNRKFIEAVGG